MRVAWTVTIVVALAASLGACDAEAPSAPSLTSHESSVHAIPPEPSRGPTPAVDAATGSTPTKPATTAPAAEPLALGGTWVNPGSGSRLTAYSTTLSARPTATGDGTTTFTKVVFRVSTKGTARIVACRATEPGRNGVWSCQADLLKLGIPPGKVTFSFDVAGAGVPVAKSPDGLRRVTYAVKPPRPTSTHLQQIEQPDFVHGDNHPLLHRVRWSSPAGYADEFLVYETFECPRPSTKENSGKPCFVAGTPVDTSRLELRAKATGEARSVKVRLWEGECIAGHGTILLRARNAYGKSVFAIVDAAPVIWVPPGDMIC